MSAVRSPSSARSARPGIGASSLPRLRNHSRAYRDPVTPSEAVFELLRCRGSQFDPDVVRAFLDGVTAH